MKVCFFNCFYNIFFFLFEEEYLKCIGVIFMRRRIIDVFDSGFFIIGRCFLNDILLVFESFRGDVYYLFVFF